MKAEVGDKVRLKAGKHVGKRGTVEALNGVELLVRLDGLAIKVRIQPKDATNYSLAARKAWKTEPHRAVGRRKGTCLSDRVSVTLRLNRELWETFQGLEKEGVIEDRTLLINEWLQEKLAEVRHRKR